ncbi:hypothetical protein ACSBR2_042307 [Camellia fascicularis]
MAQDTLSIQITIVALKSAFCIGGQITNKYCSSIMPKNVEVILCTQDWLYSCREDLQEEKVLIEDFESIIA